MSSYENELLLNEFKGQIERSKSLYFFKYKSLTPDKVWELRSNLAKSNSSLGVVRRRVFKKAVLDTGKKLDESILKGHICAVFVNEPEPMDALKAVFQFKAENENAKLEALSGDYEGKLMTGAEVETLSKLPNLEGMRSQFIALLVSPMAHVLSVMEAKIDGSSSTPEQTTQTE